MDCGNIKQDAVKTTSYFRLYGGFYGRHDTFIESTIKEPSRRLYGVLEEIKPTMYKYLTETFNYWQHKILAGLVVAIFTEDFAKLLIVFALLELLDIFSKLLNLSMKCFRDIYPNTPCTITRGIGFMWQARKWRYINSFGMRTGVDKMLTYLLLLLTGAIVDVAFSIAHTPISHPLSSVVCVVLASTEALSILENLTECSPIIGNIRDKFKLKIGDKNAVNN